MVSFLPIAPFWNWVLHIFCIVLSFWTTQKHSKFYQRSIDLYHTIDHEDIEDIKEHEHNETDD